MQIDKVGALEQLLGQWTRITAYERWDFPVAFAIRDPAGGSYIVLCPFDDDAGDHRPVFAIRWTSTPVEDLASVWSSVSREPPLTEWPVQRLEFDPETNRTAVRLRT